MGSRRFELLTSAMSRQRHDQLDHEPLPPKSEGCMAFFVFNFLRKIAFHIWDIVYKREGSTPVFISCGLSHHVSVM